MDQNQLLKVVFFYPSDSRGVRSYSVIGGARRAPTDTATETMFSFIVHVQRMEMTSKVGYEAPPSLPRPPAPRGAPLGHRHLNFHKHVITVCGRFILLRAFIFCVPPIPTS